MKHTLIIALLLSICCINLPAQSCFPVPGLSCEDATLVCSLKELDGFVCRNIPPPNATGPWPLCPNGGVPNNMHWFEFVAESDSVAMEFIATNCTAVNGQLGIQVGVYTDCTFNEAIICDATCFIGLKTVSFRTIPCQNYYLFIDGCNGSQCDYIINVLHGIDTTKRLDTFELSIPDTICYGSDLCMSASTQSNCIPNFLWRIDGDTIQDNGSSICISELEGGEHNVCIKATLGNQNIICESTDWICEVVVVDSVLDTVSLPSETICFEERFGLFFSECRTLIDPIPGVQEVCCTLQDSIGCWFQLCKEYRIKDKPEEGNELVVQCKQETYQLPNGQIVTQCGNYITHIPKGGPNGCDTIINYEITSIEPVVYLYESGCYGGSFCVNAIVRFACPLSINPGYSSSWIHKSSGDLVAENTDTLCINEPGEYCYLIQSEYNGILCPTKQFCINVKDRRPSSPQIFGNLMPCRDTLLYLAEINGQNVDEYEWTISDGEFIGSNNSEWVRIDFTGVSANEVELCIRIRNECGYSKFECETIYLTPDMLNADFIVDLRSDTAEFRAFSPGATQYKWDFGDGNESYDKNPIHVYKLPGRYIVKLIAFNSCASDTIEKEIMLFFTNVLSNKYDHLFEIFPNPTSDIIHISAGEAIYSVSVYSIDGKLVRQEVFVNGVETVREANFTGLANGIYFVRVVGQKGSGVVKVVKE